MIYVVSLVLGYLMVGISQVSRELTANPSDRPNWTDNPSFGVLFLQSTVLVFPKIVLKYNFLNIPHGYAARNIAYAFVEFAIAVAAMSLFAFGCIVMPSFLTDNQWLLFVGAVACLYVGFLFLLPIYSLLLMPVTLVIQLIFCGFIDLVLPKKKQSR